jgi:hypothetical protein
MIASIRLLPFVVAYAALAQDADPLAGIQGLVVNALTSEPVVRAHVTLTPDGDASKQKFGALTTPEGKFSILRLPPGSYMIAAERVGYVPSMVKEKIALQAGPTLEDVKVKLTPLGAISGRVVGPDGKPVEWVNVFAEHASKRTKYVTTDENGAFRIGGLNPGGYRVKAEPHILFSGPPEIRTDGTRDVHYVPAYYPNSTTAKMAERVHVFPGEESRGVEIQLRTGPFVRVSGKVLNPLGPALGGIWIAQGSISSAVSFRADGSFEIWGLNPGRYSLRTHGPFTPGVPVTVSKTVEVEVGDSNIDGIQLTPIAPLVISGRIEYEDDAAKPRSSAALPQLLFQDPNGSGTLGRADIAQNDSFRLDKARPQKYRAALSWPTVYVKSMRFGGTEIQGSILDLSSGSSGTLEILASSALGGVSGTVRNGDSPAVGALVALISDDPDDHSVARYTTSANDGNYSFDEIPPGVYKLAAVNERDTKTIDDIEDYGEAVETIEVHEHEKISKDLVWSTPEPHR